MTPDEWMEDQMNAFGEVPRLDQPGLSTDYKKLKRDVEPSTPTRMKTRDELLAQFDPSRPTGEEWLQIKRDADQWHQEWWRNYLKEHSNG